MRIQNISRKILCFLSIILFVIYSFLALTNLICTTHISTTQNDYREYAYHTSDNPAVTLLLMLIIFCIFFIINKLFNNIKCSLVNFCAKHKFINLTTFLRITISILICLLGFIWIFMAKTYPVHDQSIVSGAASAFINGDYSLLNPGEYLYMYPHQLGIVFIFQLFYSVVGENNTTFIMLLNVLLLCATYNFLFMTLKKFTSSSKVYNIYWIFTLFTFAPMFYCTFVYGTIIGLFFAVAAVYFLISFLENNRLPYFIISFILFCIACIAKSNYKIFVVAAFLILLFKAFQYKRLLLIPLAVIISLSMSAPSVITTYYSSASGIKIDNGAPSILWVAMGLQEGPCGNGWYNQYNVTTYSNAGGDADRAKQAAIDDISKSVSHFTNNPSYAFHFFLEKTISQWNEPSFQSLWMSDYWGNHTGELTSTADNIYHGALNKILLKIMDISAFLIWLGCAVFYFTKRKNLTIEQLSFGIIFIGGFIFHLFWEAKALYTMPYFVLSVVAGAWGISILYDYFKYFMEKILYRTMKS